MRSMSDHCAYDRGVAALLTDDPAGAARWFSAVVAAEPEAVLGHAGLAVSLWALSAGEDAAAALALARRRGLSRRDRHHVTIVALLLTGSAARGTALAREHLDEFPDDAVVGYLLARHG